MTAEKWTENHYRDEDCAGRIDPDTDVCDGCGVDHSAKCPDCFGRGFHRYDCPQVKA